MYKTREGFVTALGAPEMPAQFGARYDEVMAAYKSAEVPFLQESSLDGMALIPGASLGIRSISTTASCALAC